MTVGEQSEFILAVEFSQSVKTLSILRENIYFILNLLFCIWNESDVQQNILVFSFVAKYNIEARWTCNILKNKIFYWRNNTDLKSLQFRNFQVNRTYTKIITLMYFWKRIFNTANFSNLTGVENVVSWINSQLQFFDFALLQTHVAQNRNLNKPWPPNEVDCAEALADDPESPGKKKRRSL